MSSETKRVRRQNFWIGTIILAIGGTLGYVLGRMHGSFVYIGDGSSSVSLGERGGLSISDGSSKIQIGGKGWW
ncbi:MAG: hypothetical protein Edafosvirus2_19 [Edafosvirus sp.]|uniref:Uncharacterized protein n=1 Tax=Edafosvirus sp. TaxID=2487765 RepID=A0A3G4ZSG3_9VIRU|nr:MAG: hypothetical protein Edafosvirus2_19 [Edafosvirus sp.]